MLACLLAATWSLAVQHGVIQLMGLHALSRLWLILSIYGSACSDCLLIIQGIHMWL